MTVYAYSLYHNAYATLESVMGVRRKRAHPRLCLQSRSGVGQVLFTPLLVLGTSSSSTLHTVFVKSRNTTFYYMITFSHIASPSLEYNCLRILPKHNVQSRLVICVINFPVFPPSNNKPHVFGISSNWACTKVSASWMSILPFFRALLSAATASSER